jgi:hypothetical protein
LTRAGAIWAGFCLALSGCNCGLVPTVDGAPCDPGNTCPSGYLCVAGFCQMQSGTGGGGGGSDLCQGISCDMPPPQKCVSTTVLRTYSGMCTPSSGTCNYAPTDTTCMSGCANGFCVGDMCAGITCTMPPAAKCEGSSLVTFAQSGTCAGGTCMYTPTMKDCGAGGCANGACVSLGEKFDQVLPRVHFPINAIDQAPGSQGANVVVVGPAGTLSSWNGTSWVQAPTPANAADFNAIWFANANTAYIATSKGLSKWTGGALSVVNNFPSLTGTGTPIDVHGRGADDFVVAADDATVYRFANASWTTTTQSALSGPYAMNGVFVDESGHIGVYGACNGSQCILYSTNGTSYTAHTDNSGTFNALGPGLDPPTGTHTFLWAGLDNETIRRFDSGALIVDFDSNDVPDNSQLTGDGPVLKMAGVTGAATGRATWVLTGSGTQAFGSLYRVAGLASSPVATQLSNVFYDTQTMTKTDSAGVVFVDTRTATGGNTIVRRSGTVEEALDLGAEAWAAVAPAGNNGFVLLNAFGDVAASLGATTFQLHRTTDSITGTGIAAGNTFALYVGFTSNGAFARKVPLTQGSTYVDLTIPNAPAQLNAICRVSDTEWYLVGNDGSAYKSDGSTLTEMSTPTVEHLQAVDCGGTSGVALACGNNGTVLKLTNGTWSAVTGAPQANFTSCRLTGSTMYAGADGTFAKYSNNTWSQEPSLPSLTALVAVSANEVYGVTNGTQIQRFNGSTWSSSATAPQTLVGGGLVGGHVMFAGKAGVVMEGQ